MVAGTSIGRLLAVVVVLLAVAGLVLAASVMPTVSSESPASDALDRDVASPPDGAGEALSERVGGAAGEDASARAADVGGSGGSGGSSGGGRSAPADGANPHISGNSFESAPGGEAVGAAMLGLAGLFAALGGSPDDVPTDAVSGGGGAPVGGEQAAGADPSAAGGNAGGGPQMNPGGSSDRSGGLFDVPLSLSGFTGALGGGSSGAGGDWSIDAGAPSTGGSNADSADVSTDGTNDGASDGTDSTTAGGGDADETGGTDADGSGADADEATGETGGSSGDEDAGSTGGTDGSDDGAEGGETGDDSIDASIGDGEDSADGSTDGESSTDGNAGSTDGSEDPSLERSDLDEGAGDEGGPLEGATDGIGGVPTIGIALVVAAILGYVLVTRDDPVGTLLSLPRRIVSVVMGALVGLSNVLERAVRALGRVTTVAELPGLLVGALVGALASARDRAGSAAEGVPFVGSGAGDEDDAQPAASTSTARERIHEAWDAVVAASAVRRRRIATPAEVARSATASGAPRDPVETITEAFRDVEYGERDADERVGPATTASERLDSAMAADGDEDDGADAQPANDGIDDRTADEGDEVDDE